jgi:UDP-N-acetyl-D-mannosaminuronic acid dehydrogenase/UDP-N-acetyl-D-glucosamine dehydrogenase
MGRDRTTKVVVAGQGYVGLPLAMRAVAAGYDVVGYEVNPDRAKGLEAGESYVEDISDAELAAALDTGRYCPTSDSRNLSGFDVAVITVPTPLSDGVPDLSYIESATNTLSRFLRPGATVVLESTTYPGTTEELVGGLLQQGSGLLPGLDFSLGYSPERIDPGNAAWNFVNTPKVVSGIDADSLAAVRAFYETLVDEVIPVSGTREAELTKLLENTFRHVNIALVNELAMFAGNLGINIWEAIDAASTKPFGYMRFTPGPGVGGHCLPIDPSYLSWRVKSSLGMSFRFVELANDINDHMPDYVVRRLQEALNARKLPVNGSRVLLLGLTYKKNTSDARESPGIQVARQLVTMGAVVRAADPHVREALPLNVELVDLTEKELVESDAVVLLADHDAFDFEMLERHAPFILDTRARLNGPQVERL